MTSTRLDRDLVLLEPKLCEKQTSWIKDENCYFGLLLDESERVLARSKHACEA